MHTLGGQAVRRPSEVFAEQMRIQRSRRGWTQRQLAARLRTLGLVVHQTKIGKWEAGERRITLDEALAICVALDVSPAHMIAGSYSDAGVGEPRVALSAATAPASAREMRMWLRGQQSLWGQDEKRYYTEVAQDEWLAMQRPVWPDYFAEFRTSSTHGATTIASPRSRSWSRWATSSVASVGHSLAKRRGRADTSSSRQRTSRAPSY